MLVGQFNRIFSRRILMKMEFRSQRRKTTNMAAVTSTGKNNGFPFLDIFGYLKNIPNQVPRLGLVSLFQIWDFCGYSLNTQKYRKIGIRYFFLWSRANQSEISRAQFVFL